MNEEFRKGYDNPLAAESQAARMGATQRQWDDERNARRAAPTPPTLDYSGGQGEAGGWGGRGGWFAPRSSPSNDAARQRHAAPPAGIGDSARTGALLGAVGALLYLYFNHRWSIPLAVVWGVAGLVGGFIAGAVLHLAFIVLRIALALALWGLIAWVVLYMLGVLPLREHRTGARAREAVKVAAPAMPLARAPQLPR